MGKAVFVLALMMLTLAAPLAQAAPVCQSTPVFRADLMFVCADVDEGWVRHYNGDIALGVSPAPAVIIFENDARIMIGSGPSDADIYLKTRNAGITEIFIDDTRVATCGVIILPGVTIDNRDCVGSNDPPEIGSLNDIVSFILFVVNDGFRLVREVCPSPPRCAVPF